MRIIFLVLAIAVAGAAGGATLGYRAGTGAWPGLDALKREQPVPRAAAETPAPASPATAGQARKVLYYRNPMGLPDTSPTPKKDWMGMDYIAVYEGEEAGDSSVRVGIERVQRVGVRTAPAERRVLTQPVRAAGAVQLDERRIKSVTLRFDGYIEKLFANATEQFVREGEPLFRVYSQPLQLAQVDLAYALRENKARGTPPDADRVVESAMVRMRNLGVPESRIREVRESGANPRTLDWPAPMSGVVVEKKVIEGQRAQAGDELFRIADLGTVWIIAEVPEQDLGRVRVGDRATARLRALPGETREGRVTFIYTRLKNETRTGRIRIELPNPDLHLKVDMYADVTIETGAGEAMAVAVPDAAVIDAGARQVAFVAKGEGRFEPRAVKLGRRGDGYVEILDGIGEGEEVVVAAAFLIDAESNLKAALQGFVQPEPPK
jgi:Cu(I)/Ag(I) efflux system membrane fusion protein